MSYLIQEKHEPDGDGGNYGVYWADLALASSRKNALKWIEDDDGFGRSVLRILPLVGEVEQVELVETKQSTFRTEEHNFKFE